MNLGGMGQMMGAVPGGFQQGQIANNQIDQQHLQLIDQQAKQVGMQAYFRALQGMFNPQGGPPQQAPMPGQPSVAGPQMSSQAMPGPQMGSPAPMAMNNGQPALGSDGGIMPPMQSSPASGAQPGGSPGGQQSPPAMSPGGQPQQQMTWQQIAQALKQQNPGVDDLSLAHALDKFMPMMTLQAQADWRNVRSQVLESIAGIKAGAQVDSAGIRADATTTAATTRAAGTVDAAGVRANASRDVAGTRAETQAAAEAGRDRRFDTAEDRRERGLSQRESQFQQREQRLQDGLQLRTDSTWVRLQQQKEALEQRVRQGDRRQAVTELRAVIDAQHKLAIEKIQATNINSAMKPKDREQFIKEQNEQYRAEIEKLRGLATQRGNLTDDGPVTGMSVEDKPFSSQTPAAPRTDTEDGDTIKYNNLKEYYRRNTTAPISDEDRAFMRSYKPRVTTPSTQPVPQAFAADPDGTTYQKDGKTWVKRGDQLVIESAPGPQSMSDEQPDPVRGGQQYAMDARKPPLGEVGGGRGGGGGYTPPTRGAANESRGFEGLPKDYSNIQNIVSDWARGRMTPKQVKTELERRGWSMDRYELRKSRSPDIEVFAPDGTAHYITP